MLAYVVRRLAYGFLTVLGVLGLLFVLFFLYATPEEMGRRALGEKAPPEVIEQWVVNHGYDKPAWSFSAPRESLLWDHYRRMLTFDFGASDADDSLIGPQIRRRMVPSLVLTVPLFVTGLGLGVALVVYASSLSLFAAASSSLSVRHEVIWKVPSRPRPGPDLGKSWVHWDRAVLLFPMMLI